MVKNNMPDKKKVFIVGGTGRIGTLIIDNLFKNYKDDYEVIGVQSRGIKEAPKILKEANIKIYSNLIFWCFILTFASE